jgi:ABC-type nitrate/sulfonate/bicarbonate transport system substrate-binding protein
MKRNYSAAMNRRTLLSNGLKLAGGSAAAFASGIMIRGAPAHAATPLGFQLSWIKSAQYSGYFSGLDQGYFSEAGLDVTFNSGGPNIDPIANVASGRSALGDRPAGSLVVAREKGIPVKIIGTVFQRNPFAMLSLPEKPINTVKDMVGKTVAVSPSARPLMANLFKDNGIDPASVNIVPAAPDPSALVTKQIDGYVGYETNQGVMLKTRGIPIVILNLHDLGFPETAGTIYGREDFLAANKDATVAFLRAAAKSWQWTIDNPEAATKLTVEKYGVSGLDPVAVKGEIEASKPFIQAGIAQQQGLLSLDMKLYDKVLDTYRTAGMIKSDMKATDLCDPQFINAAHARAG